MARLPAVPRTLTSSSRTTIELLCRGDLGPAAMSLGRLRAGKALQETLQLCAEQNGKSCLQGSCKVAFLGNRPERMRTKF